MVTDPLYIESTASYKNKSAILTVKDLCVKAGNQSVLNNISFTVNDNEQWLLTGASGVGKTLLAKALSNQVYNSGIIDFNFASKQTTRSTVKFVEQWYKFSNHSNTHDFYYQQRYHSQDADDAITVEDDLKSSIDLSEPAIKNKALDYARRLSLQHRLVAPLIQLSSGEQKKLQLIKVLLGNHAYIILDNPFIGTDQQSKTELNHILSEMAAEGTHFIIISDASDIPTCITHIAELKHDKITVTKKHLFQHKENAQQQFTPAANILDSITENTSATVADLKNVTVRYEEKTVLDNINWRIKRGERWLLQGPNGAGKSTLLSLLTGDNPKAYSNEIYLFEKRRGSGETIWDIKKKIGFVSPELHWYFDVHTTLTDTLVSGFFDTTGLYKKPSLQQTEKATEWLHFLQIKQKPFARFKDISIGEQRLLLIARAFIKNPPLLILDEPCQGLDDRQSANILSLIDALMKDENRTLIFVSHRKDQIPACITNTFLLKSNHQLQQNSNIEKTT